MEKRELSFKGRGASVMAVFNGITLPGVPAVLRELRDAGDLVTERTVIFDFKDLRVTKTWLLDFLRDVIFPMNLVVASWISSNDETLGVLSSFGLRTEGVVVTAPLTNSTLKVVTTPIRSGQSQQFEGDVLLMGKLHHGAELSATGSIIVMGELLGQVHAGCTGDNSACVITTSYQTNQLRIGSMICNAQDPGASPWWGKAVRIFIEGDGFMVSEFSVNKEK